MRVKKKSLYPYKGKVCDLKVSNSKTYNVEGLGVHNSAAGSLVNYCLGITQIDPLQYELLWERFLGRHRCLSKETLVLTPAGFKKMDEVEVGDIVVSADGTSKVIEKHEEFHDLQVRLTIGGETFICAPHHRWIVERDGAQVEVPTIELRENDDIITRAG